MNNITILLMPEPLYILAWWLFLLLLGITGLPLSKLVFKKFFDGGYGLGKILGLLVVSYTIFLLSTFKLLPFTRPILLLVLACYAGVNLLIYIKQQETFQKFLAKKLPLIVFEEIIFTSGFLLWTYVRAHQPDINGLEKFMDFGFVNSLVRSDFLPPVDMWFSGKSINYYWFGHFVTALIIKITNIPSGVGYNLMLATILGLGLTSTFSLVTSLVTNFKKKISKRKVILAGLVSAILLNFAGNFHAPYYIYKEGFDKYWYPDATRFIGYNPDVDDKTIHEFPIYSYVVSDLHAHLLNFPFVLLFLSLLYGFISTRSKTRSSLQFWRFNIFKLIGHPQIKILILLGLTLGVMFMTNAWDFANYLLVAGFVVLLYNLRKNRFSIEAFYKTAVRLTVIIAIAILAVIPFVMNFE